MMDETLVQVTSDGTTVVVQDAALLRTLIVAAESAIDASITDAEADIAAIAAGVAASADAAEASAIAAAASEAEAAADLAAINTSELFDLGLVLPYLPTPADIYANFNVNRYLNDGHAFVTFASWLADAGGTFTRGGSLHPYFNSSGVLVNGSADTARISYNPSNLAIGPSLLIEPGKSNDYAWTREVFAGYASAWSFAISNITSTDNNAQGLDGTTNAGTIRETTATGTHYAFYYWGPATVSTGELKCFQFIFRPVGRTKFDLDPDYTCGLGTVSIDTAAMTVSDASWNIEAWNGGAVRVWKSWTVPAVATPVVSFIVYIKDAAGLTSYAGDVAKGFDVLHLQMETVAVAGADGTSPIERPNSAAGSRSADAMSITLPAGTTKLTYVFADDSQQVVTVSAGAYSVPTNLNKPKIKSLISVDLGTASIAITNWAGKAGPNVTAVQADIVGLKVTDSPTFVAVNTSGKTQTFGGYKIFNDGVFYGWNASSSTGWTNADRGVIIGRSQVRPPTFSNSSIIGPDAAAGTTLAGGNVSTSIIMGDTAAGGSLVISGCVVLGNEAGNGPGSLSGGNVIGNATNFDGSAGGSSFFDVMGQNACRFMRPVNTVAVGWSAGTGNIATKGSHTQSVFVGASAGSLLVGDRTGNVIVGYNLQAPTTTTDNYKSFADVLTYSGTTLTLQTPAGGKAKTVIKGLAASTSYANDAAAAAGGVGIDEIYRNGSIVQVRVS